MSYGRASSSLAGCAKLYSRSSVGSERLPYKQGVIGSNPIESTKYPLSGVTVAQGIVIPLVRVRISAGGLKSKTV